VRDEHPVSLDRETSGAEVLLAAAGIDAEVELAVDAANLPRPVDELLAWATREGVANVLRHSQASACTIRLARRDGSVMLEIVNDGAGPASSGGSGLSGLGERAQALRGSVTAGHVADGRFRLLVEVPELRA
jgi:two-component system sensor histidine kinase DesK